MHVSRNLSSNIISATINSWLIRLTRPLTWHFPWSHWLDKKRDVRTTFVKRDSECVRRSLNQSSRWIQNSKKRFFMCCQYMPFFPLFLFLEDRRTRLVQWSHPWCQDILDLSDLSIIIVGVRLSLRKSSSRPPPSVGAFDIGYVLSFVSWRPNWWVSCIKKWHLLLYHQLLISPFLQLHKGPWLWSGQDRTKVEEAEETPYE
jgi:hypothetical protein